MKVLIIGGTGTISTAVTRLLAKTKHEVVLLNRGSKREEVPENVSIIPCDINNETDAVAALDGMSFDVVCEFIGFEVGQLERDYRLCR